MPSGERAGEHPWETRLLLGPVDIAVPLQMSYVGMTLFGLVVGVTAVGLVIRMVFSGRKQLVEETSVDDAHHSAPSH